MRNDLDTIRCTFRNSVIKGSEIERSINTFLENHLPKNLSVVNGEVIDSTGKRSKQTDTIILNEDHPFKYSTQNRTGLFFIEGVCGAGEVKTLLTSTELQRTLKNAQHFKNLTTNIGKGTLIFANQSDIDRYFKHPPFFLFAMESNIDLQGIRKIIEKNSINNQDSIDAIFILDEGWAINFGDGKGAFQFITQQKHSVEGWVYQKSTSVLFNFLRFISLTIPRMIRFEPILANYIFK